MKINTDTERRVEVPWLLERLSSAGSDTRPTRILDIGSSDALYLAEMVKTGAEVYGIDTRPFTAPAGVQTYVYSVTDMPEEWFRWFDLVTCISVIDHVGLAAYGNEIDPYAPLYALREIERVTATNGRLLLTTPTGRDLVTTHGNSGGQRVISLATLHDMFPSHLWEWTAVNFWVLRGEEYVPCTHEETINAGYAGHRAAAVAALELVKR